MFVPDFFVFQNHRGIFESFSILKLFNRFLPDQKFRMETLSSFLLQLLSLNWAVSIDLKDAYFHVPIHRSSRRLLGFQFLDRVFQYVALPFGLKNSPWVFMRVLTTVVEFLCKARGSYVLLPRRLAHSRRVKKPSFVLSVSCVTQSTGSGVLGELEKVFARASESTGFFFLGAVLDIPRRLARPTEHRVVALQNLVQELSLKRLVTARRWQVFLGHLVSMVDLVPHCRLLMRHLQIYFLRFFSPMKDDQEKLIPFSEEI